MKNTTFLLKLKNVKNKHNLRILTVQRTKIENLQIREKLSIIWPKDT